MVQATQHCKCGEILQHVHILLKQSENVTIGEFGLICPKCLDPIEIDLTRWGLKCEDTI